MIEASQRTAWIPASAGMTGFSKPLTKIVIPAKAGTQATYAADFEARRKAGLTALYQTPSFPRKREPSDTRFSPASISWVPVFAGMTKLAKTTDNTVVPAQAGIQATHAADLEATRRAGLTALYQTPSFPRKREPSDTRFSPARISWVSAFAGMTKLAKTAGNTVIPAQAGIQATHVIAAKLN